MTDVVVETCERGCTLVAFTVESPVVVAVVVDDSARPAKVSFTRQ